MPPSMFDDPFQHICPPDATANGHCKEFAICKIRETSFVTFGLSIHAG